MRIEASDNVLLSYLMTLLFLLIILFVGEPDLHDAIISRIMVR